MAPVEEPAMNAEQLDELIREAPWPGAKALSYGAVLHPRFSGPDEPRQRAGCANGNEGLRRRAATA
jgi:hypothetical protein